MNMHVIDLKTNTTGMKFSTAGRMATEILAYERTHNSCLPRDLHKLGFAHNEVLDNWDAAHFLIIIDNLDAWGENNRD